jgi:hypothetical protein
MILNIQNNETHSHILKQISLLINNNPYTDIVIFSNNSDAISTHNVPIFHLNHAKFFNGNLWLFDIVSIILAQKFTNVNKKIFWANDIPWIKNRNNSYYEWHKLYSNIEFICANKYLYDIYKICWKQPLDIMETFDYEKIQHILRTIV